VAARDPLHGAKADPLTLPSDEIDIDEPLAESAPLARSLAPRLCRPVGPGTPDCSSYHGLLQYMRMLGVVASPLRQRGFYAKALREVPPAPRTRVLVAGAADYCMLALVLGAYRDRSVEVTVVDRCPTPLELCRWFAARAGVTVATAVADLARFEDADGFDVICTDSLLTLLRPEERARVLSRWRSLLAPGGRVVTSARISSSDYLTDVPREQRVAGFAELVRERAREAALDIDLDVLAAEALTYGASVPVYPIRSVDEVEAACADAGLVVDVLDLRETQGRVPAEKAGPGAYLTATYARLVARSC
jgi:SAM-dependent methyltransferase